MNPTPKYLAFLDRRIPELMGMGKPDLPKARTKGEEAARIFANLAAAAYPGRLARLQADKEWADKRKEAA